MSKPVRFTAEGVYIGDQLIAAADLSADDFTVTPLGGDLFTVGITLFASKVTFESIPGHIGVQVNPVINTLPAAPGLSESDVARIAAKNVAWEVR